MLVNAYRSEEQQFLKTLQRVPRHLVPDASNIISSHVLYRMKINYDFFLQLKARIASHGNEDPFKNAVKSDCCIRAPTVTRVVLSVASLQKWRVVKADAKSAFLQTGPAGRDVYLAPPCKSKMKNELRLLLATVYGLVNANGKWRVRSDDISKPLGLTSLHEI